MTDGTRYFAFMRAINTGGRRLTNDQLLEPFIRLGLEDVAAYQAAGNVTFRSDQPAMGLTERLEAALAQAYGFDAPVFLRSRAELSAVGDAQPFGEDELAGSDGRVQVSFMRGAPAAAAIEEVAGLVPEEDRVAFVGREWFWLPVRGISDSKLPVPSIERLVGPMTMRTLGTVGRMLRKFA